jgi:hypothetical protein
MGQFLPEEISEFEQWETYLKEAKTTDSEQMLSRYAVTEPWILDLELDGTSRKALWKNPEGRVKGYVEGWRWEIAAYRLSNYLELYMIPPTVEKRFNENPGSCQLWQENCRSLRDVLQGVKDNTIKIPGPKRAGFSRALFLQRAFDNLIANEDRHQNLYIVTADCRILLVDHSRSFRTSNKFVKNLIYDEKHKEGPLLMEKLPRNFYMKIKNLNSDIIRAEVGNYLSDKEIEALLKRKDLIIKWVDARINKIGEISVLYD